jgi:hypothetical protein
MFHRVRCAMIRRALRRDEPSAERGGHFFLHAARHGYGAHIQHAGEGFSLRQEQSGLGGLERDGGMGAHCVRTGETCTGVQPGGDIHSEDKRRVERVELCD